MIISKEKNRYSPLKYENQHGGCRGYDRLIASWEFLLDCSKRPKTKMPRHQYRIPRPVRQ